MQTESKIVPLTIQNIKANDHLDLSLEAIESQTGMKLPGEWKVKSVHNDPKDPRTMHINIEMQAPVSVETVDLSFNLKKPDNDTIPDDMVIQWTDPFTGKTKSLGKGMPHSLQGNIYELPE